MLAKQIGGQGVEKAHTRAAQRGRTRQIEGAAAHQRPQAAVGLGQVDGTFASWSTAGWTQWGSAGRYSLADLNADLTRSNDDDEPKTHRTSITSLTI